MVEVLFYLVILFGVFLQASVGFGTVVTMPLGILLMGLGVTKPVVSFIALLTGLTVLITEYKYINWRELAKMAGVMLVGVLAAQWIAGRVKMNFLLVIYGAVVIGIGVKKLFWPATKPASKAVQNLALAVAGIMQGLFVSGGSFLAVYAVERIPEKQELRATNNALWAILNTVMLALNFAGGQVDKKLLTMGAIAIIPMFLGTWLGGVFAHRIKQQTFLKIVYVILIASGVVLLISNL
ncbi:MAG: sulfite exporter TauE/SafE family protein [Clostridia bacterium]|nr:sulfite exporter TauE/SafE family protein [Clostridia bacterium]MBQ6865866.1 sulfite exporter TauE/SafE family protein [Clostridia bacterium]MBR0421551.1 sulfite exporter TauE/SafE family protein [Clostridia bacterium]